MRGVLFSQLQDFVAQVKTALVYPKEMLKLLLAIFVTNSCIRKKM